MADPKEMYSTTHKNKKGFCKFELLLIILLVLIGAFLSIPLINSLTSYTDVSGDNNEQLDSWNRGLDLNNSENSVKILNTH